MKIIAVDPGYTTGIAIGQSHAPKMFDVIETIELHWEQRFDMLELLDRYTPDVVVMEDFKLYAHKAESQINSPFPSARVIGSMDAFCWQRSVKVAMQPAVCIARVAVLKQHVEAVGSSPHTRDAYKHLRYYVLMNT